MLPRRPSLGRPSTTTATIWFSAAETSCAYGSSESPARISRSARLPFSIDPTKASQPSMAAGVEVTIRTRAS